MEAFSRLGSELGCCMVQRREGRCIVQHLSYAGALTLQKYALPFTCPSLFRKSFDRFTEINWYTPSSTEISLYARARITQKFCISTFTLHTPGCFTSVTMGACLQSPGCFPAVPRPFLSALVDICVHLSDTRVLQGSSFPMPSSSLMPHSFSLRSHPSCFRIHTSRRHDV